MNDREFALHWLAMQGASRSVPVPEPMTLAAWLDRRLSEDEAAPVELALAADRALFDAIRDQLLPTAEAVPPPAVIERACALVQAGDAGSPQDANILRFSRRGVAVRRSGWLIWGAMAASLLLASFAGFGAGTTVVDDLATAQRASGQSASDASDIPVLNDDLG